MSTRISVLVIYVFIKVIEIIVLICTCSDLFTGFFFFFVFFFALRLSVERPKSLTEENKTKLVTSACCILKKKNTKSCGRSVFSSVTKSTYDGIIIIIRQRVCPDGECDSHVLCFYVFSIYPKKPRFPLGLVVGKYRDSSL